MTDLDADEVDPWINSPPELRALIAEAMSAVPRRERTPEQIWRDDYRKQMAAQRTWGVQLDMWGEHSVHYRRSPPKPVCADPRPVETRVEQRARIAQFREATHGPGRADRPTFLTDEQRDEIVRGAANWLRVGQRVRVIDGPGDVDPEYGLGRTIGREGVVWRPCSAVFRDHVYVFLDPVGAERTDKIAFLELRDVEPIE
jgi:hypothetical protein